LKNKVRFIILFWFQICFQNINRTKNMDFILSGWYLRRKKPIFSIKYITHRMKNTLRVKCSTKIVYSFENFNFIVRISKICVTQSWNLNNLGIFSTNYIIIVKKYFMRPNKIYIFRISSTTKSTKWRDLSNVEICEIF